MVWRAGVSERYRQAQAAGAGSRRRQQARPRSSKPGPIGGGGRRHWWRLRMAAIMAAVRGPAAVKGLDAKVTCAHGQHVQANAGAPTQPRRQRASGGRRPTAPKAAGPAGQKAVLRRRLVLIPRPRPARPTRARARARSPGGGAFPAGPAGLRRPRIRYGHRLGVPSPAPGAPGRPLGVRTATAGPRSLNKTEVPTADCSTHLAWDRLW